MLANDIGKYGYQLVIDDFDGEGRPELYLNMNKPYFKVPRPLKNVGISSAKILMDYSGGSLVWKQY